MKEYRRVIIQVALFSVTFITTTLSGSEWTYGKSVWSETYSWQDFFEGMEYSIPFLLFLTVHELGHYFTAMYHRVRATLPYYIPLPAIPFFLPLSIGTLGAVIRLKDRVHSTKQHFDIGIAGPLAGFIMAVCILIYGFTHLPPADYIFQIHPEYKTYGMDYAEHVYTQKDIIDIRIGENLLFSFFRTVVADPSRVPNMHEVMHYPFLFAGFLSLFFTSLNLLPMGQLDGGHILYGLVGQKYHSIVASVVYVVLIFYGSLGILDWNLPVAELAFYALLYIGFLYIALTTLKLTRKDTLMYAVLMFGLQFLLFKVAPGVKGYPMWLVFGFLMGRLAGIRHPLSVIEEPLDSGRKILGWIAFGIFIICFTPMPINVAIPAP